MLTCRVPLQVVTVVNTVFKSNNTKLKFQSTALSATVLSTFIYLIPVGNIAYTYTYNAMHLWALKGRSVEYLRKHHFIAIHVESI